MNKPNRYKDFRGPERAELAASLKKKYEAGDSVRQLANSIRRTYAFVHTMLEEAGTVFRDSRGAAPKEGPTGGAPVGMRRIYWDGTKNTVVPWNEGK